MSAELSELYKVGDFVVFRAVSTLHKGRVGYIERIEPTNLCSYALKIIDPLTLVHIGWFDGVYVKHIEG
jgi:hypothetical protein